MLIVPMLDQGGLERVCAKTGQLLKLEYEVHIVVFNTKDMIYDVSGVDLIDLNLPAVNGKLGKITNVFKRVIAVKKLKKKLKIQLSYSFGPTANIVNVLSKVNDFTWIGIRGYGALSSKSTMSLTCKKADRVISCTKVMEAEINEEFSPKRSAVLYNPCDIDNISKLMKDKADIDISGNIVVSMGREHDVKGFWHLIKAVYLAKKQIPDIKLMIVGAGEYTEYKELATRLGIKDDVIFTGVKSNPYPYLAMSSVYALTSDSEGFPNALIEAMAVGLPCISVNCLTGPAEILNDDYQKCNNRNKIYYADYGILTPVFKREKNLDEKSFDKEEELFADEIVKLFKNKELLNSYKEKSLRRARDFGEEIYEKELKRLIRLDLKIE
jgi:glycosyltransferase involved in cell wall biosynthesis